MICLLHRWLVSHAENARRPLSARARTHVAGCPDCARFERSVRELGQRLHAEGWDLVAGEAPLHLTERVLAFNDRGRSPGAAPGKRRLVMALAVTGVALAVAAAALLRTSPAGEPPRVAAMVAPALRAESVVEAFSPRLLEHELDALTTGTRNAITFLRSRVAPQMGSPE